jgi:hypothetical protein
MTSSEPGLQMNFPSPTKPEELYALERINKDKSVSNYAPGVIVKYGANHDVEVRVLQFIHGQLSISRPPVLRHAPFPKGFVKP